MPFLNPLLLANLADKQGVIVFCHCLFRNVKEVGNLADKAFISFGCYICRFSIIYKSVEQKGVTGSTLLTTGCWLHIVIGNGCWDVEDIACLDFVTGKGVCDFFRRTRITRITRIIILGVFNNFGKLFGREFFLEAGIEYSMRSGCSWHSATNGHYARELLPEP